MKLPRMVRFYALICKMQTDKHWRFLCASEHRSTLGEAARAYMRQTKYRIVRLQIPEPQPRSR